MEHIKNNRRNNYRMMWRMVLCIVLLGILFLGGSVLPFSGYLWPIIIGVFILMHIWLMFRTNHGCNTEDDSSRNRSQQEDNQSKI